MKTHYEVLGVPRAASPIEIRSAYRGLASRMHPDKFGGTPEANAAFTEITAAYACLSDYDARKRYDASLLILGRKCPACKGEGRTAKQVGFVQKSWLPCKACNGSGLER